MFYLMAYWILPVASLMVGGCGRLLQVLLTRVGHTPSEMSSMLHLGVDRPVHSSYLSIALNNCKLLPLPEAIWQ